MKPLRHYLILSAIAATICSNTVQAQCDTVSNLTLTYGKRNIQTNWDAVKDAIGYSVAISTTETVPHVGNLTVDNNFLFNGLKPDQKYCVFVQTKCNDVDNPKSEWIKTCGTMPCTDEQPDITKLEIENEDPTKWLAQWTLDAPPGGGYGYALTVSEDEPNHGTMTQDTSVLIERLKPATKYCFHVRYYCPNSQTFTQWAVKCFTTPEASGVNSIKAGGHINISPNPASKQVNISMPSIHSAHTIMVSDITGRAVYNLQTASENTQLNTAELTQGMYFIHVSGKEYNTTQKLLVR